MAILCYFHSRTFHLGEFQIILKSLLLHYSYGDGDSSLFLFLGVIELDLQVFAPTLFYGDGNSSSFSFLG